MSISVLEGNLPRHTKRIQEFLQKLELEYDFSIEYSVIIEDNGEIVATGSLHENVLKCIGVSKEHQGMGYMAKIITHLAQEMIRRGISHYFVFTKPKNLQMFKDLGFFEIICTDDVLLMENKKAGILSYVETLKKNSENRIKNYKNAQRIGAIVANCNPFTNGHKFLIETASVQCDLLHIFVLSEENGMFSANQRYEMVKNGVSHLENVVLHQTSDYLISHATFPTYFIKDKAKANDINCRLDLEIFYEYIVKNLNISTRFVGKEPFCEVTNAYNQNMRAFFKEKGLNFIEIERKTINNRAVSATYVRQLILEENFDELKAFLPKTTLAFLKK